MYVAIQESKTVKYLLFIFIDVPILGGNSTSVLLLVKNVRIATDLCSANNRSTSPPLLATV